MSILLDTLNRNIRWNEDLKKTIKEINDTIVEALDDSDDGRFLGEVISNLFEMESIADRYGLKTNKEINYD